MLCQCHMCLSRSMGGTDRYCRVLALSNFWSEGAARADCSTGASRACNTNVYHTVGISANIRALGELTTRYRLLNRP